MIKALILLAALAWTHEIDDARVPDRSPARALPVPTSTPIATRAAIVMYRDDAENEATRGALKQALSHVLVKLDCKVSGSTVRTVAAVPSTTYMMCLVLVGVSCGHPCVSSFPSQNHLAGFFKI